MNCDLVTQLNHLKRSSIDSVDNANFRKNNDAYFHVRRPIEDELRELLREVNSSDKKRLVLLCGSAGDGKSHLLSYLWHSDADNENLLADFDNIYNDASTSKKPELTAIETLAEELKEFDDEHYGDGDGYKMILAINLGTLSNFIESAFASNYQQLKKYVEDQGIIAEYTSENRFDPESVFQYISFSDYHIFALTKDGATYHYLDQLIDKIVSSDGENPFEKAYLKCESCPHKQCCPIKDNFSFLRDENCKRTIEYCLLEVEFKDKYILSTRDILDFINRVIVPPDYQQVLDGMVSTDVNVQFASYVNSTLPSLLFEGDDSSTIFAALIKNDPLKDRDISIDREAIRIHSILDIKKEYLKITEGTPYTDLEKLDHWDVIGEKDPLKQMVFNFMVRLHAIKGDQIRNNEKDSFKEYLKCIYYQNTHQDSELAQLYNITSKAVMLWNGKFKENFLCIQNDDSPYWLLEHLKLKPVINISIAGAPQAETVRYSPVLKIALKEKNASDSDAVELNMDYSLFLLVIKMGTGYYPTAHDRNLHADFDNFIKKLSESGDMGSIINIQDKDSDTNYIFEYDAFGKYTFKVDQ